MAASEFQLRPPRNLDVGRYNYTYPKAPIMAMFHSPGPCHGLPTLVGKEKHDFRSVHFCNPAWPFGIRPKGTGKDECSPGAGAYSIDPKMQRTGRGYSPQYSIASRRPDPAQAFKPPGPGAYCPEKCGHIASRIPPSFTFGKRHKLRSMDQTPGPNRYSLPNMLGTTPQAGKKSAPSAIIRSRNAQGRFDEDLGKTPGPASYDTIDTDLFKNRIPAYSMGHKFGLPGDGTVKPGPSTYNPMYNLHRNYPPQTFGMRHSPYTSPLITNPTDD
ncbi:hypothetical protein BaRGS_00011434 [Batillaria attramentaria]|uniref:Outer dense fiber protein 3 n=1 Tax=Batillaria attramentaria TaxID=370345 RepID=A0ABD0LD84_9CAEN